MGHGTHWEAVVTDVGGDLPNVIPRAISAGRIVGRRKMRAWIGPGGQGDADCTLVESAPSGFGCEVVVVGDESPHNYLHTAFPVAVRSQSHSFVRSVREYCYGLEASITGTIGETQLTFFDPYYSLSSNLYEPGKELDVVLSGIFYHLEVVDPKERVMHSTAGEVHQREDAILLPMGAAEQRALPLDGFGLSYMIAPSACPGADDYTFRGPVREMQSADFFSRPARRITTTLLRLNDAESDVDIDVYVLDERIRDGEMPEVGDDIEGALWLQGFVPIPDSR